MHFNKELKEKLKHKGADFVRFIDISDLSNEQNKGFDSAILIGAVLSPGFVRKVVDATDYVGDLKINNLLDEDELRVKEMKIDSLADYVADFLSSKGYKAYSQSERNIFATGCYDEDNKSTPLPHKTIALLSGLGWIGKNNLIVTPEYGSAISMCTVLTNAPVKTVLNTSFITHCGDCDLCVRVCPEGAIKDVVWEIGISRNQIVDVYSCSTCLKCMVVCPWTQKYMKKKMIQ